MKRQANLQDKTTFTLAYFNGSLNSEVLAPLASQFILILKQNDFIFSAHWRRGEGNVGLEINTLIHQMIEPNLPHM